MTQSTFGGENLLPMVRKVVSQTIGKNLVSVQPISNPISEERLEKLSKEVQQTNRESKIESIVTGSDHQEIKIEDHPDYNSIFGKGNLFYLDYLYGTSSTSH